MRCVREDWKCRRGLGVGRLGAGREALQYVNNWQGRTGANLLYVCPHSPADPYVPPQELHSVPLRRLHIRTCKDAFRLQPDCPDLKVCLSKGSRCSRPLPGTLKLVVRIPAGH